jgi:hypothetical protein
MQRTLPAACELRLSRQNGLRLVVWIRPLLGSLRCGCRVCDPLQSTVLVHLAGSESAAFQDKSRVKSSTGGEKAGAMPGLQREKRQQLGKIVR